ncbi:uncharacterized protein LOC132278087 [Cornus florida]|uniref:uncharacterized protein LOC132278087 n=1 Tax=Cornus florida TaxID=4283 RepID=UPI0028983341|nr:uncharacterized protein LOC132278087 [Cornus florida]
MATSKLVVPQNEPTSFYGSPELLSPRLWPKKEIVSCWSSIAKINECIIDINDAILKGQFTSLVGECCEDISKIVNSCWPKLFPFLPEFSALIKDYCAKVAQAPTTVKGIISMVACMATSEPTTLVYPPSESRVFYGGPGVLPPRWSNKELLSCWSSITKINGCITDIHEALLKGQFTSLITECFEDISKIVDGCWPRLFPFLPEFSALIKDYCAKVVQAPSIHGA